MNYYTRVQEMDSRKAQYSSGNNKQTYPTAFSKVELELAIERAEAKNDNNDITVIVNNCKKIIKR